MLGVEGEDACTDFSISFVILNRQRIRTRVDIVLCTHEKVKWIGI